MTSPAQGTTVINPARHGLVKSFVPVPEVEARVEPFENGRGFSLRVLRAGKPRQRTAPNPP